MCKAVKSLWFGYLIPQPFRFTTLDSKRAGGYAGFFQSRTLLVVDLSSFRKGEKKTVVMMNFNGMLGETGRSQNEI